MVAMCYMLIQRGDVFHFYRCISRLVDTCAAAPEDAHNPEVVGSNPTPATVFKGTCSDASPFFRASKTPFVHEAKAPPTTFGSQLAQNGVSLYKISTLMGNSPEICRRHYAALVPETMAAEVEFGDFPTQSHAIAH
jgi:hypothetical protein